MKKLRCSSELAFLFALLLIAFSVSLSAASDLGLSMIAAPAYILSLKLGITFGQCEYLVQGVLFLVFCLLMKKVRLVYFTSFLTGLVYGALLDLCRLVFPALNPAITPPGSQSIPLRLLLFAGGMVFTALSIALFFRTYLTPMVYDFFVKGVSVHFSLNLTKFKILFDASCLVFSCILSFLLFSSLVGVGIGTLVIALLNGALIGFFGKILDRFLDFEPTFPRFARHFALR